MTAFAEDDQAQLKRLLSYELLQSFIQTIHDRTAAKALEITVNDIREVSILNIELNDCLCIFMIKPGLRVMSTGMLWKKVTLNRVNSSISGLLNVTLP